MPRKHIDTPSAYNDPFPTAFRALLSGETGKRGKVSQQEVADYIGKTRQTVGYYADGTAKPDIDTIGKIAAFFDVSTDYLLGRSNYTDARLRIGTFEDYGFSEKAVRNINLIHDLHYFTKLGAYKGEEDEERDAILSGKAFDVLVRVLEDSRFIDFLKKAAVCSTFHAPGDYIAEGSITDASGEKYLVQMGAAVLRDVFMAQAIEPLKELLNDMEKENREKEGADGEQ